jgi:hypothetical protein
VIKEARLPSRFIYLSKLLGFLADYLAYNQTLAICSTSNSQEFNGILLSTAGVVFLGTPHRGSAAAGIGKIARKAASMLLMDTNKHILNSLSLTNSDLERCQEVFSSLWLKHNFRVKTFQEGLPLKLPFRLGQSRMSKVVPDTSSCLGDSRERAETLEGDHREMCRFASVRDPNFKKVGAEVRAVYSAIHSVAEAAETSQAASVHGRLTQLSATLHDQCKEMSTNTRSQMADDKLNHAFLFLQANSITSSSAVCTSGSSPSASPRTTPANGYRIPRPSELG